MLSVLRGIVFGEHDDPVWDEKELRECPVNARDRRLGPATTNGDRLFAACFYGYVDRARKCLQMRGHGAAGGGGFNEAVVLERRINNKTALHIAATTGTIAIVRALLAAGAEVNARDSRGDTPLILAADAGHSIVVEVLLKTAAESSVSIVDTQNNFGFAAIHRAAMKGNLACGTSLLELGRCNVQLQTQQGLTAVDLARFYKRFTMIPQLLSRGSNDSNKPTGETNCTACCGATPATSHQAAGSGPLLLSANGQMLASLGYTDAVSTNSGNLSSSSGMMHAMSQSPPVSNGSGTNLTVNSTNNLLQRNSSSSAASPPAATGAPTASKDTAPGIFLKPSMVVSPSADDNRYNSSSDVEDDSQEDGPTPLRPMLLRQSSGGDDASPMSTSSNCNCPTSNNNNHSATMMAVSSSNSDFFLSPVSAQKSGRSLSKEERSARKEKFRPPALYRSCTHQRTTTPQAHADDEQPALTTTPQVCSPSLVPPAAEGAHDLRFSWSFAGPGANPSAAGLPSPPATHRDAFGGGSASALGGSSNHYDSEAEREEVDHVRSLRRMSLHGGGCGASNCSTASTGGGGGGGGGVPGLSRHQIQLQRERQVQAEEESSTGVSPPKFSYEVANGRPISSPTDWAGYM